MRTINSSAEKVRHSGAIFKKPSKFVLCDAWVMTVEEQWKWGRGEPKEEEKKSYSFC
jgi:hypothetical protein